MSRSGLIVGVGSNCHIDLFHKRGCCLVGGDRTMRNGRRIDVVGLVVFEHRDGQVKAIIAVVTTTRRISSEPERYALTRAGFVKTMSTIPCGELFFLSCHIFIIIPIFTSVAYTEDLHKVCNTINMQTIAFRCYDLYATTVIGVVVTRIVKVIAPVGAAALATVVVEFERPQEVSVSIYRSAICVCWNDELLICVHRHQDVMTCRRA